MVVSGAKLCENVRPVKERRLPRTASRLEEQRVLAANEVFYAAFRERDMQAMHAIWARHVSVICVHPGMDAVEGMQTVLASWHSILQHPRSPRIGCSRAQVRLLGDTAIVTCLEGVVDEAPRLIATNVFVLEDDVWRLVHHHAAPLSLDTPRSKRKGVLPRILN